MFKATQNTAHYNELISLTSLTSLTYLTSLGFIDSMMGQMRSAARLDVLSILYSNCISDSSLISHGFTPQQITTLLSRNGGTKCMNIISYNYNTLKTRCKNEDMILMGLNSGGSDTISVYSSEIYTRLIDLKYTKKQILSLALRRSGSSYMTILANNTGRITEANTNITAKKLFEDSKKYKAVCTFEEYIQQVCSDQGVKYVGMNQNQLQFHDSSIPRQDVHPQAPIIKNGAPTEHQDKKQKIDECNMIETPLATSTTQMFRPTIGNSTPIELDSDSDLDSDLQFNDNIEMEPTLEQKGNSTLIELDSDSDSDVQLNDNIEMEPTLEQKGNSTLIDLDSDLQLNGIFEIEPELELELEQKDNSSPIDWGDNFQHNHSIYIDAEPDHTAVLLAHNYFSCLFSPNDEFYARELKEDDLDIDALGKITLKQGVTGIRLF